MNQPVGFPWLEQKVTEWGCMQALIDFEGWRKWRGFMDSPGPSTPATDTAASPMQGGHLKQIPQEDPPSPSSARKSSSKSDDAPSRPRLGDESVLQEDSWGSGSPDSLDSPSSANMSTPAEVAPTSDAKDGSE
jgi:osomolarity two-component system response regulator SSK1